MSKRTVAVVDIGSTSIQLTIAEVNADTLTVIFKEKSLARLADEIDSGGYLKPSALRHIEAILARFSTISTDHGARLHITATATLRAAKNKSEVIQSIKDRLGLTIRLLTGHDEARFVLSGVLFGHPEFRKETFLTVDVGGGSTELITASGGGPSTIASVPLGALIVQQKWLGFEEPSWSNVHHARQCLRARFDNALTLSQAINVNHLIGTGGTIQRLVRLHSGENLQTHEINGRRLTKADLDVCIDRLVRARTPQGRRALPAMDPDRADFLLGGALIYTVMLERFNAQDWFVSTSALRTGMLTSKGV